MATSQPSMRAPRSLPGNSRRPSTSATAYVSALARASDHGSAIAFCHGVLAGAYGYYVAATPAAQRFVCPPEQKVTRAQVADAFVGWLKANPPHNNDGAVDALFRFAAGAYPCKS